MADTYEGRTATSKDKQSRQVWRSGMWVKDTSYVPPQAKATTTNADMRALEQANATAAAEREVAPTFIQAAKALDDLGGTGPWKEWLMGAGAPGQSDAGPDRGWLGNTAGMIGGALRSVVGTAARPLYSQKELQARDRLRTISANGALSRSSLLKGPATDRDMDIIRTGGLQLSKTTGENRQVITDGIKHSGLNQTRALVTNRWITDNGSLSAKNSNGLTYQEAMQRAEGRYAQSFAERQAARRQGPRQLPALPPRLRSAPADQTVTIDLDGNTVR